VFTQYGLIRPTERLQMIHQREVAIGRKPHSGAWEVAAIVSGYRVARVYYGFSKREAIRLFMAEVNGGAK
jgi:hypothetical protein